MADNSENNHFPKKIYKNKTNECLELLCGEEAVLSSLALSTKERLWPRLRKVLLLIGGDMNGMSC